MTMRVAIAGASGYAGGEVARLLEHPEFDVATLTAHSGRAERRAGSPAP
jgi:N-acetyl-gamma-glutamyl-phosphate reductase